MKKAVPTCYHSGGIYLTGIIRLESNIIYNLNLNGLTFNQHCTNVFSSVFVNLTGVEGNLEEIHQQTPSINALTLKGCYIHRQ